MIITSLQRPPYCLYLVTCALLLKAFFERHHAPPLHRTDAMLGLRPCELSKEPHTHTAPRICGEPYATECEGMACDAHFWQHWAQADRVYFLMSRSLSQPLTLCISVGVPRWMLYAGPWHPVPC